MDHWRGKKLIIRGWGGAKNPGESAPLNFRCLAWGFFAAPRHKCFFFVTSSRRLAQLATNIERLGRCVLLTAFPSRLAVTSALLGNNDISRGHGRHAIYPCSRACIIFESCMFNTVILSKLLGKIVVSSRADIT